MTDKSHSIPSRSKQVLGSPNHPCSLWGPLILPFSKYWAASLGGKSDGA